MSLYPLKFNLKNMDRDYVWGGQKLLQFGKTGSKNKPLAEVWEVSDRPEDNMVSIIQNGKLRGKSLAYLMAHYKKELLGNDYSSEKKFPLLIKFIDARETLSLQVHPDEKSAKVLKSDPKTEAWLILSGSDPEAKVWIGLKNETSKEDLVGAIENNSIIQKIEEYKVSPDEIYSIPSGTIHAIGAGCLILEVQENSNTTYRLFDWGRDRELHIKEGLIAADLKKSKNIKLKNGKLTNNIFSLKISRKTGSLKTNNRFKIIVNLSNQKLQILYKEHTLLLKQFETCLIPACCEDFILNGEQAKYTLIE